MCVYAQKQQTPSLEFQTNLLQSVVPKAAVQELMISDVHGSFLHAACAPVCCAYFAHI